MTRAIRRVGLISDTHGLVRDAVREAFAGVDMILHAGDVVGAHVLDELAAIAPVLAAPGNCDDPGHPRLRSPLVVALDGIDVRVTHGHELGSPTPGRLLARYPEPIVVYGHTHRALVHRQGTRIAVNPGSAGPRRFHLEPSVAVLTLGGSAPRIEIVTLA